jgi:hypothetical protein
MQAVTELVLPSLPYDTISDRVEAASESDDLGSRPSLDGRSTKLNKAEIDVRYLDMG